MMLRKKLLRLLWPIVIAVCFTAVCVSMAQASFFHTYSSRVDGSVSSFGSGLYEYTFTVVNTSEPIDVYQIVDWELPIFGIDDVDKNSIMAPPGWEFEFIQPGDSTAYYNNPDGPYGEYRWDYDPINDPQLISGPNPYAVDPQRFVDPPYIIHWFTPLNPYDGLPTNPIHAFGADNPDSSLSGFRFVSGFSATNAPNETSWYLNPNRVGDPPIPGFFSAIIPNSPAFRGPTAVPEPSVLTVVGVGLFMLVAAFRRKQKPIF